ncbi:MAG: hypothetical protein IBJ17_10115 [Reyranella sp.]|nr:hypothetical protein [Reyranella sp.]
MFRDDLTDFGLYEVLAEVKYGLDIEDDDRVKTLTLEVVREMLPRGAPVDFGNGPLAGTDYPEKTPDEVVARIERAWDALGRLPDMGEVCYIAYPKYEQGRPGG